MERTWFTGFPTHPNQLRQRVADGGQQVTRRAGAAIANASSGEATALVKESEFVLETLRFAQSVGLPAMTRLFTTPMSRAMQVPLWHRSSTAYPDRHTSTGHRTRS